MRCVLIIAAFLLAVPAQAQQWFQAETAHFIIKSRDSEADTRAFAERVERFDRGLRFLNGLPEDHVEESVANKPIIYRFGNYSDMARMAGAPGSGIGGFFIPRAGASVAFVPVEGQRRTDVRERRARSDNPDDVLFHEYTHYFMLQNAPAAYPRWYSEGYAEMMSTMRFHADGSFHIGDVPQGRAYQIYQMTDSRLREMLDATHQLNARDAIQHYGTGWLLSHYLSFNPEREAKLRAFLIALGNGEDSLTAATRIFGDLDELQAELRRYKRGDFPGYDMRPNVLTHPEVTIRAMDGAEVALIEEEMALWRGVTHEQAAGAARRLRALVAQYPQSAHAHALLAEAEHDSRNYAAAETAAARAVELDPQHARGWLLRAMIASDQGRTQAAFYEVARDHLARARAIDSADPRPLIAYYETFHAENPAALPEHAIIALESAYEKAGSDFAYRMMLARQLAMENRLREAKVVALPALFGGHRTEAEDEDGFTPERLFEALDNGNGPRAVELLDTVLDPAEDEAA